MDYAPRYYGRHGEPVTREVWLQLCAGDHAVARDELFDGAVYVDTRWMTVDMSGGRTPEPLIYETMAFRRGNILDNYTRRYTTEEQALQGHAEVVAEVELCEGRITALTTPRRAPES